MKSNHIIYNSAWLICWAIFFPSFLQAQEATREIIRTLPVKPGMTLFVSNRQGEMHIETWDKPEVKFVGNITLQGPDGDILENRLEQMKIDISSDEKNIRIQNQTPTANRMVWSSQPKQGTYLFNLQSFYGISSEKTDFHLTIPKNLKVVVDHQYGDLFLGNTDADVVLTLRHGELKGETLSGNSNLSLAYVNGSIKKLGKSTIEAQKSQLHILGARKLDIHSAYSEFEIDQADSLISSHRHNQFEIKNVGYIKMDEDYSDVNVFHLFNEGDFKFNYGDLKLNWVAPNFHYLNLTGELTDFDVKVDTSATFSLEIDSDLSDIEIPNDVVILSKKDFPAMNTLKIQGVKGLENLKTIRYPENYFIKEKNSKRIVIITRNGGVILK
ncbi:MAG: hypothetical protein R3C61_27915 [Bacteroidia bacterium]